MLKTLTVVHKVWNGIIVLWIDGLANVPFKNGDLDYDIVDHGSK